MQPLVLLGICVQISYVLSTAEVKPGANANAIPVTQRPEMYYVEPSEQPHTNFIPVQVIPKPIFLSQQPTMLIIAQPTYVPQQVLYGNPATAQQQLLNYFHSNPQAKYQFLYGGQPQPTVPPAFVTQNAIGASSLASYDVLPHPFLNHVPQAPTTQFTNHYAQPMQLNQIAQLAQSAAQQFNTPIRSVPPIITGFENFTPEQQVQIKAQLRAHLGAPLATTASIPTTTTQSTQKSEDKNAPSTANYNTPGAVMYRGQYTKG
ncbi:uncharacterized protein LOC116167735 [Photinus pyralis]|uniref:Uncharacterized protein n=1 Tax=Photinus pyralis TaxID=7054 RepID=A0A1Y1LIE8_PHOPY|nr:uncharacterized protein LOC116167735 [Photinus pyralis]